MGVIKTVSAKLHAMRQHARDKKQFFNSLLQAVQDGRLADEELDQLSRQYKEFGLTDKDLKKVRIAAFTMAYNSAKADGQITDDEYANLREIQQFLKIPDAEIVGTKKELRRLRLLGEIQSGNLPTLSDPYVRLQKSEVAHWQERASLLDERVIDHHYEGGSQGVSFRIAKGVSYRVGGHRGHIVSEKGIVPVSHGYLVITNQRIIFAGDPQSFSLKLANILHTNVYGDGLKFTVENGKSKLIQFDSHDNADIVAAIFSKLIT